MKSGWNEIGTKWNWDEIKLGRIVRGQNVRGRNEIGTNCKGTKCNGTKGRGTHKTINCSTLDWNKMSFFYLLNHFSYAIQRRYEKGKNVFVILDTKSNIYTKLYYLKNPVKIWLIIKFWRPFMTKETFQLRYSVRKRGQPL